MDSPSKLLSRDCCPHPLGRRQTDAGAHESLGKPAKPTAGFPQRPLGLVCAWLSAGVTRFGLGRYLVVAGFEVSTSGRFSPVHRGPTALRWRSPDSRLFGSVRSEPLRGTGRLTPFARPEGVTVCRTVSCWRLSDEAEPEPTRRVRPNNALHLTALS